MKEFDEVDLLLAVNQTDSPLLIYLYTPLCGTCQLARRMLDIVEVMLPNLLLASCNINVMPALAQEWRIESIPCLVFVEKGVPVRRVYRMGAVDELHAMLEPYNGKG